MRRGTIFFWGFITGVVVLGVTITVTTKAIKKYEIRPSKQHQVAKEY